MSDEIVDVGPFNLIMESPDAEDHKALTQLGARLEALATTARALDALHRAGMRIPDECYKMVLMVAALSPHAPHRPEMVERARREVFAMKLQRLRKQGVPIPLQAWEQT
jgi:hypothetical protein